MSTPHPTGRLVEGREGLDLVVTRTLPGSLQDAWESLTDPERTARWMGRWKGTGAPGETIRVQMAFEEGAPWMEVRVTQCDPPHRLRVVTLSEHAPWDLSFELTGAGDRCELRFVHHGVAPAEVGEVGPGWEYYLDRLLAAATDGPQPSWEDYPDAQRAYYEQQLG
ncbi:SRPBCC family protein [Phycicoccus endophyticus]|uniref:SRPBCC family protein n=1 Tax=Phycicoccus endophyticus TaxID=1690220 RepID=A0A7G9R0Z3_9MICO|nr:SRPBCC family protein [Phycicoccus endophyticus]NHI19566.1 SRPBCC family protein [Phycicoccus endophyticus]QNN49268.1 SRPBCC family protein [Phycicoccus endophyticus]GGL40173.1 hypothetical protein GCM10012283_23390 [Phycicoccus endophyticus]